MENSPKEIRVNISKALTEGELKDIHLFLRKARELESTRILSQGSKISMTINSEIGSPPQFVVSLPDEEYLRSVYLAFRFFYLEGEKTNFNRIANIVKRRSGDEGARTFIDRLKAQWVGALGREQIQMSVDGQEMTPSLLMDLWFNAHYFHSDEEKDEKLTNIKRALTEDGCRYMLADAVFEAAQAVLDMAHALKGLDEKKQ